jgi:hypothetical protein
MTPRRVQKQGTRTLCETLRFINEVSVDIAKDQRNSSADRKAAAAVAEKARRDGVSWGCTWAERA